MTRPNYMMITVAKCGEVFKDEALNLIGAVTKELKSGAGAVTTRYGVVSTGEYTNQLILFQTYVGMAGFEAAFDLYGRSATYRKLVDEPSIEVSTRTMLKIEDLALPNETTEPPAFGVVTRWGCRDLLLDQLRPELAHFEAGGAMLMRYCTILSGPTAGRRLLVAGYPSLDAVDKTYEHLRGSAGYRKILSQIDLDWRNIFRVVG